MNPDEIQARDEQIRKDERAKIAAMCRARGKGHRNIVTNWGTWYWMLSDEERKKYQVKSTEADDIAGVLERMNERAVDEYVSTLIQCEDSLAIIKNHIGTDNLPRSPEDIDWADVGDAKRLLANLAEIREWLGV